MKKTIIYGLLIALTIGGLYFWWTKAEQYNFQPDRVEKIPADAFWVGGADGGYWYLMDSINTTDKTIHFKIYNDSSGGLIVDKILTLQCDNSVDIKWDNIRGQIRTFDGERIILTTINADNKHYCVFE